MEGREGWRETYIKSTTDFRVANKLRKLGTAPGNIQRGTETYH